MSKITKRLVESTTASERDIVLRDSETKGFLCKITPKGKRVYLLYYRTAGGRERRPVIGVHGQITCEQARDIAKRWLSEVSNGGDPSADRKSTKAVLTIAELSKRYMDEHGQHLKKRSFDEINRIWKQYIIPEIGNLKITDIRREDVAKLHQSYKEKPYMANRIFETLRSSFTLAEKWELVPDGFNPCRHIKKFPEKARERFLTKEELAKLNEVLIDEEIKRTEMQSVINALRLLIFTGCRLNEILTLKWQFVNFEHSCLRLPESKTGAKTVYLAPYVLDLLRNIARAEDNPYVITGRNSGTHLINLQKPWSRIRKKAGIEDVRMHDLRHSFISIGAANGLLLPILGALAGHRNPQTTQLYAHLAGDPLKEAAEFIGKHISNAMAAKSG